MAEKLSRTGERGEVFDEDVSWENAVRNAGPNAITSWQRVRFGEEYVPRCWADAFYQDGTPHGCFETATTSIGLCAGCYEEMVGSV